MALTYSPKVDIRGAALEPVFMELLFLNNTVSKNLVTFHENIKNDTIVSEGSHTVTMQAYGCGAPSASGDITISDISITPVKVLYYDEFCPETLRPTRFNRSMKSGAWNIDSSEFTQLIMDNIAPAIASDAEFKFWNNATAATKAAVAALTPGVGQASVGADEQTLVAATTAGLFDGVVTRMIYNNGGVGARVKVNGVLAIDATNIATEYARLYAAIPSVVLNGREDQAPYIYAPFSHKQFINIYNVSATYRDLFSVSGSGTSAKYYYNGIEIVFVPLPEQVMICARPDHILWCTDLLSDTNELKIDKLQNNADTMFYKAVFTEFAHIVRQSMNVLYIGGVA